MSIHNIWEQIGKQSKKVYFQFNLIENKFDLLTDGAAHMLGAEQEEIHRHPEALYQLLAEEDREAFGRHKSKLLCGEPSEQTFRLTLEKRLRFICFDTYPIKDESGRVVAIAGVAEDVSNERQFHNYLTEFAQRKDSMLEMVSHDLRGPLAVVKSVAGLLRRDVADSRQQEVNKYTGIIEDACNNCINLINDLLSEEHLRSPQVYVNKTRVNLTEEVRRITEFYKQGQFVSQTIDLDLPEEPLMVELDQIKFSQILNNLISNSIKFTPPDGRILITARKEKEGLLLQHQDNGIGIPENLQPALFDRYTRSGRTGLKGEKSRGLGLSIVRELVELQGGRIWLESRENNGATFFIRLPVYD